MSKQLRGNNSGFTIVELMIATAVLSVILVLVAIVMTNIGRLYFKGSNQAKVQNNVRTISSDIAQRLQLSSGQMAPADDDGSNPVKAYCIGTARYTYVVNEQLGGDDTEYKHVLWRDRVPAGTCENTIDLRSDNPGGTEGVELVTTKSRITHFTIDFGDLGGPSVINLGLAYGDEDLFTAATRGTSNPKCAGEAGGQFCATASLTTKLMRRVAGD